MDEITIAIAESSTQYFVSAYWYAFVWRFEWCKEEAETDKIEYLTNVKNEARLLVQHEIDSWAQPVPIVI